MYNKLPIASFTLATLVAVAGCTGANDVPGSSSQAGTSADAANSSSEAGIVSSEASAASQSSAPVVASSASSEAATSLVLQESALGFCRLAGVIEADHTGFTGAGYANGDNASGADIAWQIQSASAQAATITLRYANGGDAPRAASLSVNGANAQTLQFAVTGWSDWQELTVNLDLSAGSHTIALTSDSTAGLANIDALTVTGVDITPGDCPLPPPKPLAMNTERWYVLVNRASNQVFDIQGIDTASGSLLTQWERTDTENQQFRFVDSGDNHYRLVARHSGLALDLYEFVTDDGADIVQWEDLNGDNQNFEIRDLGNGYVQLINTLSQKALAPDHSSVAGARITQYPPSTDLAQQWQLVNFAAYSGSGDDNWTTTVPYTPELMRGDLGIHDPSTILKDGDWYWTFGTGGGGTAMTSLRSRDLINWQRGPATNPGDPYPDWVDRDYPPADNNLWAPDMIKMNDRYYLYYSVFASPVLNTAIGVMVTDSLNNPNWQDLGPVITQGGEGRTAPGEPTNVIDPGLFCDADGRVWMVYGSHYGGIFVREINPQNGMLLNPAASGRTLVAGNRGGWNEYEAAQIHYINGYYYLFINLGGCCVQWSADYIMVVGRSDSPTGPFITQNGHNLANGDAISPDDVARITAQQKDDSITDKSTINTNGALLFTEKYGPATEDVRAGPGHFGYLYNKGQHLVSIHYYGRPANGWGVLGIVEMTFENGWPVLDYEFELRQ